MQFYTEKDLDLFKDRMDQYSDEIKKKQLELFDPKEPEIKAVYKLIVEYIKKRRRTIYGGYALNALVCDKDKKDAIYKPTDYADIEFYSPTPIQDLAELCNELQKAGFTGISGKEAQHSETYTVFCSYKQYCDISYVPSNLYNKLPYKEIDGLKMTHPYFMTIDYLRMFIDPLNSGRRWDKAFKRYYLLQKHYQLPAKKNRSTIVNHPSLDTDVQQVIDTILTRESIIVIGQLAFNHYYEVSKIDANYIKPLPVSIIEVISTQFNTDVTDLVNSLKAISKDHFDKIRIVEYYPFFQFLGHSAEIYFGDRLLCRVYHHYRTCTPFKTVTHTGKKISVGTVHVLIKSLLSQIMKLRIDDQKDDVDEKYTQVSHLMEMRNYYLKQNKLSPFDDSDFQDLIVECKGETIPPERERFLKIDFRKKQGKKLTFVYDPDRDRGKDFSSYKFANSSGNSIKNVKNLKIDLREQSKVSSTSIVDELIGEEKELEEDSINYEKNPKKITKAVATESSDEEELDVELTSELPDSDSA